MRIMKQVWLAHLGMNVDLEINHAPSPQIAPSQPYFESSSEPYHFFSLSSKEFLRRPDMIRDWSVRVNTAEVIIRDTPVYREVFACTPLVVLRSAYLKGNYLRLAMLKRNEGL